MAAVSGKVARAMIAAPAQKGGPAAQKGAAAEGGASKKVAKRVLKADCSVVPCKNVEADMPEHERPSLGAFGRNFENCKLKEPRYLTTAIMYSNGPPHIGHTYETVMTDVHMILRIFSFTLLCYGMQLMITKLFFFKNNLL